jgi:hypothetical protein
MKAQDLTGLRFGRLLVTHRSPNNKHGNVMFHCRCDCGIEKDILAADLKRGFSQSCGCLHKDILLRHGHTKAHGRSKTYGIWNSLTQRCDNPNSPQYPCYGARGIIYDPRWKDFREFLADMGEAPEGKSIERIDNNGNYCKENCRWATAREQAVNRRDNIVLTFNGKTKCLTEWARDIRMNPITLYCRLKRFDWSIEKAITTPVRGSTVRQPKQRRA